MQQRSSPGQREDDNMADEPISSEEEQPEQHPNILNWRTRLPEYVLAVSGNARRFGEVTAMDEHAEEGAATARTFVIVDCTVASAGLLIEVREQHRPCCMST
jgi:hypothetical protein